MRARVSQSVVVVTTALAIGSGACGDGAGPSARSEMIGYIATVRGTWLATDDTVHLGRGVSRSDTIRPAADASRSGELGIVLTNGRSLRLLCELPGDCTRPLVPADSIRPRSAGDRVSQVVRAVASTIQESPGRYESLISRGGDAGPSEVILLLDTDGVHLGPLVTTLPAGVYTGSAWHLSRDEADDALRFAFEWDPRTPGPSALPLPAGLYEVVIGNELNASVLGAPAWALVVDQEGYDEARTAFLEAEALTESWGPDAWSEARAFLRAYLDVLAEGVR